MSIDVMKQALDALEHEAQKGNDDAYRVERDALRAAIEQAQPELEQAMTDAIIGGTGVMLGDKRIDPAIHYCHRFAILMECVMLGGVDKYWDEMGTLLDEYHKARDTWAEAHGQPYVSGFGKD